MFATDILQLIYSPRKALKKIVENPKYWGALLVLLLFLGLQIAFQYAQYSQNSFELTAPEFGRMSSWNSNSTLWTPSEGLSVGNNYEDFINSTVYLGPPYYSYYSIFGNSSLQFDSTSRNTMSMTLENLTVDCSATGFRNLTMAIKIVQPQATPQKATLTLFSFNSSDNYFQYDLTSDFAATSSTGVWNNVTVPLNADIPLWKSTGNTNWSNITGVNLTFEFSESSNITVRVGDLYFRGFYKTALEDNSNGIVFNALYLFVSQFIFEWLLLTILIYVLVKAFKGNVTWKPLFTAVGFALIVLVVRTLICLAATLVLPAVRYPYDLAVGVSNFPFGILNYPASFTGTLSAQSQAVYNNISSMTAPFQWITELAAVATYAWLGGLCSLIVQTLVPEFSLGKRVAVAVVGLLVTLILLLLVLVGVI